MRSALRFARQTSPRARWLAGVWLLFALLVAFGIHGSSTGYTAGWWMPEKPYTGYLFGPPVKAGSGEELQSERLYMMARARQVRWDELSVATPNSLSQMAQRPRFPVINRSIGNGQNMMLTANTPVWHVATLARPATWGYFVLGAQRGLAWFWWFQPLACFTVLFLLLEIIFQGDWKLAALGAFLFCSSAYVVCWSHWPAHATFFAALACLAAYHLSTSMKTRTLWVNAVLLGLALPGFVMILYPPWQVPLAYLFSFLYVALLVRDRLLDSLKTRTRLRLALLGIALALAGGLTLAWYLSCRADLQVMAQTVYPGKRTSLGGDYSFAQLFKGIYNLATSDLEIAGLKNPSEAASFYYLFPVVWLGLLLMPRLRRRLGVIGWGLTAYIAVLIFFLLVGLPEMIARLTLLSYMPPFRADIAIGLASIILTLHAARILGQSDESEAGRRRRWLTAWLPAMIGLAVGLFFLLHSRFLMHLTGDFPTQPFAIMMSFLMGLLAYLLIAGRIKTFALLLAGLQLATTVTFNPLSTNLNHIYHSELAETITRINRQSNERPFWIAYGGIHPGVLVEILGGRSLTGIQWPPQLDIWRTFDPGGYMLAQYNRYAEVSFEHTPYEQLAVFRNPQEGTLLVKVSPYHPALKSLGVRYVLLMGDAQKIVDASRLNRIYRSAFDNFSIYEIP